MAGICFTRTSRQIMQPLPAISFFSVLFFNLPVVAFPFGKQPLRFEKRKDIRHQRFEERHIVTIGISSVGHLNDSPSSEGCKMASKNINKALQSLAASAMILCLTESASPSPCLATTSVVPTSPLAAKCDARFTNDLFHSSFLLADDALQDTADYTKELGLTPPTADRPQIMLPGNSPGRTRERTPVLQGLVYFPEQLDTKFSNQPIDYLDDVLVITAVPASQPDGSILAGAKVPLSMVRFPFMFKMYEENLMLNKLGMKDSWFGTMKSEEGEPQLEDILVVARICPSDATIFPCNDAESKRYSQGVAKVITNLPGLKEGEVVRAPASLPLQ
ncbi:hypothetical protein HJC23_012367 [Cyclotella cryptica]|uniref:Uncharacterized protein n=1 Tax=Cyclotella cryptica TaxID=29204 RepID=A0ABD3QEA9_9STRA|eukprot:CCRYP_006585-RA/>CCRYP_006585-RA protein AED:0.00 eAED:0.00 QI:403/-1/1/1/-1/1/1/249/331